MYFQTTSEAGFPLLYLSMFSVNNVATARKRILGRGNVYRRVSVHGGGVCLLLGGEVHGPGGAWSRGGVPGGDTPPTATATGCTHPTGMHSCSDFFSIRKGSQLGYL